MLSLSKPHQALHVRRRIQTGRQRYYCLHKKGNETQRKEESYLPYSFSPRTDGKYGIGLETKLHATFL